jgi:tRNA-specific 2-thiouridylase
VLATDAAANTVTVGPRADLATSRVGIRDAVLHRDGGRIDAVKLRSHAAPVPASVSAAVPGRHAELELELGESFDAASPGQAAVLLAGEAIVGHGTIA